MNYIKKLKAYIFLFIISAFAFVIFWHGFGTDNHKTAAKDNSQIGKYNISSINSENSYKAEPDTIRFKRNTNAIDYSSVMFTPWDVESASANVSKRKIKPYSIMIYMNGSDLESEIGAATDDLIEILESGVSSDDVHIVIFTGGTNRWQNDLIPENSCMLWEVADGQIYELTGVGLLNMGDPGTLSGFIDFSIENFPAEKYGLILWDHGGGSIAGYGHDEKFNNSNLTLLDMNYAFEKSVLKNNNLEFLGFDSCLMASVEMAVVASNYAKYLVASEDLTPGDGWNYSFLSVLNDDPSMNGAQLGTAITDYFMDYYGPYADEDLNMSVIDLSNVDRIMNSMGNLMALCSDSLIKDRVTSFRTLAKKRNNTKTFGVGSPRDNESDMIDIGDMANKLSDLFPDESASLLSDLKKSVLYNRHNSNVDLCGLNTYYVYGGKDTGKQSLDTYTALIMDEEYTAYLHRFFNILTGSETVRTNIGNRASSQETSRSNINNYRDELISADLTLWTPVPGKQGFFIMTGIKNDKDISSDEEITENIGALWPKIEGKNVSLYKTSDSAGHSLYAVPVELNGRSADIIILFSEKHPDGKILGARNQDGFIIQKGYDEIKKGDKISFYYKARYFENDLNDEDSLWHKGDELTLNGELRLEWSKINDDKIYYSLLLTDIRHNKYFTDLKEFH